MREMWSRLADFSNRVGKAGAGFAGEFALRSLKRNYLPWLIEYLDGLGKDNLVFAVGKGITLWQIIPEEWRRRAIDDKSRFSAFSDNLEPSEAGVVIFEALVEERPDYATIVSKEWLVCSCEDYRRSRHGGK